MKTSRLLAAYSLSVIAYSSSSNAAMVTVFGDDIKFTYDDATLFGEAMVVGNSIFFLPTDFLAESLDGGPPATDTATDTLTITAEVITEGFVMEDFHLLEQGDYRLSGSGASADASGLFGVTSDTKNCGFFPCTDSSIFSTGALADTGGSLAAWDITDDIFLADTTGWDTDTVVEITLQNDLLAQTTSSGEIAFIQKKFGAIGVSVNEPVPPSIVPVPAAVWLFGSGLLGLAGIARRKKVS